MFKPAIFIISILTFLLRAEAGNIAFKTSSSEQSKGLEIQANGDLGDDEEDESKDDDIDRSSNLNWNLSISKNTSTFQEPTTKLEIIDNTASFITGLGLNTADNYSFDFDINYSTTPEENLKSIGPNFGVGYTFEFSGDDYTPTLTFNLNFEVLNTNQSFSVTAPARKKSISGKPTFGNNTIEEKAVKFEIVSKPTDWLTFKGSHKNFSYNRNVSEFLQYIDTTKLISNVSGGMSSALSGFYKNSSEVAVTFTSGNNLDLEFSYAKSQVAADNSFNIDQEIGLSFDISDSVSAGLSFIRSSSDNSSSLVSTETDAHIDYSF